MSKIVVAKLVRLGKDGDKFKKDLIAQTERTNAKVDEDYVKECNANWETSGRLYIVDKEATEKRNEEVKGYPNNNAAELEYAKIKYAELFGKAPNGKMKLETMLEKITEKENEK
jgi:hypothetical protein